MLLVFVALMLAIYRDKLKGKLNPTFAINLPKFLVIAAILLNESVMLSWRLDREHALEVVDKSYYFQWSPYSAVPDQAVDEQQ